MGLSTAETIKEITRQHLEEGNGLLLGQCVTAVGWIGNSVPNCKGIVEIPMTDVAGSSFAVGCALVGRRPIFVMRYQGFLWYNCSSLINYAGRSKEVWGVPCPVFIRCLGMEGNGVGHTASSCLHSIMCHVPGIAVAAPMTPGEYRATWEYFMSHDDPVYSSEHRKSFTLVDEMQDQIRDDAKITVIGISGGRLNALEAVKALNAQGVSADLFHLHWLKPLGIKDSLLASLRKTGRGLVVDSDFELCGISESVALHLMHKTGAKVYPLGLEDRVCGVAARVENITPSPMKIIARANEIIKGSGGAEVTSLT
jgi:acetoin:2,6-dichlorophenolindophenol oxidoreductase subunit beta